MRTSWRPIVAALTGVAVLCVPIRPATAAPTAVDPSLPVALAAALPTAATTTYRLHHGDPGAADESTSPEVTVSVHPVLTGELDPPAVRAGRPVTVTGAILPGQADVAVDLERRTGGSWRHVAGTRTAVDGSYSLTITPDLPGSWSLRVVRSVGDDGAPRAGSEVDLPPLEVFRLHHYSVTTRGTIRADMDDFRAEVAATYADSRGWARAHHRFSAVEQSSGRADFTVVLAQARMLPTYSRVCSSMYSCRVGRHVIINQDRWQHGSPHFPGTLEQYRRMVVNHETGHWLGRGHAYCAGPGRAAPVMQQQSKGLHGCRVNPWPLPREVLAVS